MDYSKILAANPGDPVFADYAEELRRSGKLDSALRICLQGLNANPDCHLGRLALAHIFYQQGYVSFATRELRELMHKCPELVSLQKLLQTLAPDQLIEAAAAEKAVEVSSEQDSTVAEAEFELGDLDLIKSDRSKNR